MSTRKTSQSAEDTAGDLAEVFGDQPWVAVYGEGRIVLAERPGQHPGVSGQYLADGLHKLTCPGCAACRPGDRKTG